MRGVRLEHHARPRTGPEVLGLVTTVTNMSRVADRAPPEARAN
jgi:hypothetical protein